MPCRHVSAVARAKAVAIEERIGELAALRDELTRLAARAEAVEAACVEGSSLCLAVEGAAPPRPIPSTQVEGIDSRCGAHGASPLSATPGRNR